MKKVLVTLNYDGNKQITLQVPKSWTKPQINAALIKKYGIYDIKTWIVLEEEPVTT